LILESGAMKKWFIRYWTESLRKSSIEQWLNELTKEQLKSVAKELKMLALAGNELKMPHSKALGKGLFELRERRYGYRIYYGFQDNQVIILLAVGDKKSQEKDIKIARERLSKI
jgi:putative addiction module killer protein